MGWELWLVGGVSMQLCREWGKSAGRGLPVTLVLASQQDRPVVKLLLGPELPEGLTCDPG